MDHILIRREMKLSYCEMDCTLDIRRVAMPAGSRRRVLYNGDTPLQLLAFI